ncbi:MAG: adenylate/guanylate cyclase domain-containing protein [Pseudomonadota bacterium]
MATSGGGARPARSGRWMAFGLGLALTLGVALARLWDPAPVELLRVQTFDAYQRAKPRDAGPAPVAILDIDEAALRRYGQFPWPRTRLAELVDAAMAAGAAAVAFDIVFAEPDRLSPERLADGLPGLDPSARAALRAAPSNDAVFAEAIARGRVVLGQGALSAAAPAAARPDDAPGASIAFQGPDPRERIVGFPQLLANLPELERAAAGRGVFSLGAERDGVVRRVPALARVEGALVPGLSVDLLRVGVGAQTILVRSAPESGTVEGLKVGPAWISTDGAARVWVYFAPPDAARYVSAADLLSGAAGGRLRDKLVLVGTSAAGLLDLRTTPIAGSTPGVEVHAQALETILTGAQLQRPDFALPMEILAAAALALVLALITPRVGAAGTLAVGAVLAGAVAYGSWTAFAEHRLLIDATYPLVSSLVVFAALAFANYQREERERGWIRGAFGRYLAPGVVERLAAEPDALTLGGETRELTLLFTDVRGFTAIAERYRDDPQGLTRLMNRFLTPMSEAITARDGTIDKYMGDAIMAFWNAPIDTPGHEGRACAAALDMLERIARLNAARRAEAEAARPGAGAEAPPIDVGVGVNTGDCVVGNVGSELRFDYSALGDPVNVASRLEGLTRQYGVPILVGAATAAKAGDGFALVAVDRLRVKGKTEPEEVFALLGGADLAAAPEFAALREAVAALRARWSAQDWDGAAGAIAAARAVDPARRLSGYFDRMSARLAQLRANPPGPGWDGVFTADEK